MRALALAALGLAACANLPDVTADECGNGVVDPGERCDTGAPGCGLADTANACLYVCNDSGPGCPDGWSCGNDDRCRQPTETFAAAGVAAMPYAGATTTDIDGDGAADLLARDSRGLVMRFGDDAGDMSDETRVPLPFADSTLCTPDVDGDHARDLAVPLANTGWALFENDRARGLIPAAQSAISLDIPGCDQITATAYRTIAEPDAPGMLISIGGKTISFLDHDACGNPPVADCVIDAAGGALVDGTFRTGNLGYGDADGVYPGDQFTAALVGSQVLSVWGENQNASEIRPKRVGAWLLSEALPAAAHLMIAEVTGDHCADVVVDTQSSIDVVPSKLDAQGDCAGLAGSGGPTIRFTHPFGAILGAGDLDGDGVAELIFFQTGIIGHGNGNFAQVSALSRDFANNGWTTRAIFATSEPPLAAAVLDYNHDNYPDVALTTEGSSTVDFYLNYRGLAFDRFPVDVGGNPGTPVVGDFDGDLEQDIVVSVADPVDPTGDDAVYIIYGDPSGRPSTPQLLGDFLSEAVPTRVTGQVESGTESVLVTSNAIAADQASCDRRLAVLIGDTSRQLVSPYVLAYNDGGTLRGLSPLGMVEMSKPDATQVLALGELVLGNTTDVVAAVLTFDGGAYQDSGINAKVDGAVLSPAAVKQASWASGDLGTDGQAEAIGISNDTAAIVHLDGSALSADVQKLPINLARPTWFDLVDMDSDGDLDLVGARFPTTAQDGTDGKSRIFVVDNVGGTLSVANAKTITLPSTLVCSDAKVIQTLASGAPQVIVSCRQNDETVLLLGVFDPDKSSTNLTDARVLHPGVTAIALQVGDYTGDGLDDIALLSGSTLTLLRQCSDDVSVLVGSCDAFAPMP